MIKIGIIGSGIYGCWIANELSKNKNNQIYIFEKNKEIMSGSSKRNQYRVHGGYHYLRSINTAARCRDNYKKFLDFFPNCIKKNIKNIYALGKHRSKIDSYQFERNCNLIGAPFKKESKYNHLFNDNLISEIYEVDETVYDYISFKNQIKNLIDKNNIKLNFETEIIKYINDNKLYTSSGEIFNVDFVFNCTYSNLEKIENLGPKKFFLNYKLSQIALIKSPSDLENLGITVIDGPFFSLLPYNNSSHTLSHVNYTHINESKNNTFNKDQNVLGENFAKNNARKMILDASRFIPSLSSVKSNESFFEVKALCRDLTHNDSRPIVVEKNHNVFNVLGAKIDNVFDLSTYLNKLNLC